LKIKGIYFLYRVLQALALPLLLLYFLVRALRNRGYWASLGQRFGFLPRTYRRTGPGAIWLHAVSVGEVLAAVGLLGRLRAEFPTSGLFVSTSTLAGRALADDKLRGLADGVFYAPVDYVFAVRRVLRTLQPSVVVILETEIWPNLFREVKRTGAGLAIVNGRISDRALGRYRRLGWFFGAVLPWADGILAQTEEIRGRFVAVGAPADRVRAAGNFKYDFEARGAPADSPVLAFIGARRLIVAASTTAPAAPDDPDEDDAVIAAWGQLAARHPDLVLLIAPRKPERFDAAARKLAAAGIGFARRTGLGADESARVLLLDTIGELSGLFPAAEVVFMGGTLTRRGGHNILEPALFAKPVVIGPHMENFQAIADEFRAAEACLEISGPAQLAEAIERLLERPEKAAAMGRKALACAQARRGATDRALEEIRELYRAQIPRYRPAMPWFAMAWALSCLWRWGSRRRQAGDLARQRKLDVPVVSIGNLTAGGTGKTPCVLRLAELLKERGRRPGILTRGYGRDTPDAQLALAPGATVSAAHSGDEPQIFVRSGLAPVGVGADRYETGLLLRRKFAPDTILLDDGFQHLRLARDVDVVLIDALQPLGGGSLIPLGRLREPAGALARAHIVLITRSESSDLPAAIERLVSRWNPRAPIFRALVEPVAWVEHRTGREFAPAEAPFRRAGAFCGVGNPQSFRRTLAGLEIETAEWIEFEDHHRYRPRELRRIVQKARDEGAAALVTTEKDAINMCEDCDELLAPLPLFWLKVRMRVAGEGAFLDEVMGRLG
jgi:3-deoxy-D-manno-octulosonic-acid transferase